MNLMDLYKYYIRNFWQYGGVSNNIFLIFKKIQV